MKKGIFITLAIILGVFAVATIGGSFYMLDYSLAPDAQRTDTAACFRQLVEDHPEVKPWLDSLRNCQALRDTFVTMPSGERHWLMQSPTARSMCLTTDNLHETFSTSIPT